MIGPQIELFRVTYSTATADAVAAFVAASYDLPSPIECILLQRGFNDSFVICAADQARYVLRMSGRRRRGDADVNSETRYLAYLDAVGVPVSAAVPNRAGALFCEAAMPEGPRPAVLFRHAEGRAPELDAPEDARAQGVTLARIHDAAEHFPDRQAGRYRLDLHHLLHRQVAAVIELKDIKDETRRYFLELSSRLDASVGALPLNWTRCHGDCHGFNARIITEGPKTGQAKFFDFDDGGYGYLAYDLAVHLWAQSSSSAAGTRCGLPSSMATAPSVPSRQPTSMRSRGSCRSGTSG
jgi:Ser/Thr protein kinase RdoA (MazF antagonist)